jgi:hexokinase
VSEAIKTGEAVILFGELRFALSQTAAVLTHIYLAADYIADSVDSFLTEIEIDVGDDEAVHLGFTFSFPVEQTALDQGKLLTWTKGFSAKNAVGHDVVKLLQDAFDRKHIHVRCSALVNDVIISPSSRLPSRS